MWRTRRTMALVAEAVAVAAVLAAAGVFIVVKGGWPAGVQEPARRSSVAAESADAYGKRQRGGLYRPYRIGDTKGMKSAGANLVSFLPAQYPGPGHVSVRSTPLPGVAIGGTLPGITDYDLSWPDECTFEAPHTATVGGAEYIFVRWTGFGSDRYGRGWNTVYPDGQNTITVLVECDSSNIITAEYVVRTWTLSVESAPCVGVEIGGTAPGTTDYTVTRANQDIVVLAAPQKPCVNGHYTNFLYWVVDGGPQAEGQVSVQITMNADRTAEARYDLLGDVNGDCRVNILDLIFIRNRLSATPDLDNSRADVNKDGTINLLDLIKVRNELGARCE